MFFHAQLLRRGTQRHPVRTIGIMADITERKQIEDELRRSEADLAEAQRIAKIGSWSLDLATNEVRWSNEVYRIFEIQKADYQNTFQAFLHWVHSDDRTRFLETNREVRAGKDTFELEYRIVTTSGKLKIIREIGYARKSPSGEVVGLFGTAQDITERRQASLALRESEKKLREQYAELEQFYRTAPVGLRNNGSGPAFRAHQRAARGHHRSPGCRNPWPCRA